jgi:hypothetical protein
MTLTTVVATSDARRNNVLFPKIVFIDSVYLPVPGSRHTRIVISCLVGGNSPVTNGFDM